jgi:regulator of protease activity HflC (stomatin/prohibitin superfamily)
MKGIVQMKLIRVVALMYTTLLLAACEMASPGPGEEAVLVAKPILFGHGGIREKPVTTGRTLVAPTTEVLIVNVQPATIKEHFEDLMSSDQQPLDFDTAIRVQVVDSVRLVREFGVNWYANNVAAEYRSIVRQAVRVHTMADMTLNPVVIDQTDQQVFENLRKFVAKEKLPIRLLAVTLGRANPPEQIKQQRIATAAQRARQDTERERKLAEDERAKAEASRAAADNAYRNAMQLSPDQFLQLEAIKMQREVCATNKTPCTFLFGSGAVPTMQVR